MILSLITLLLGLAIGAPVAFAIGFAGLAYFLSTDANLMVFSQQFIGQLSSLSLVAIPFFVLTGELMNRGGVTKRIFRFVSALLGWLPGGLGHANVASSMIFAGMSGSAIADLASLGKIELKAMRDASYPDDLSVGVTVASSTLGPIIPPSINMVVFGSIANVPIGLLFLGGVLPGVLCGVLMMVTFGILFARRRVVTQKYQSVALWPAFKDAFWSLMTPVVLLGAMFSGLATPTEAAILSTLYTVVLAGFVYRELSVREFFEAVINTVLLSGSVLVIIAFAAPLAYVISREQIAADLSRWVVASLSDGTTMLLVVAAMLFVIGTVMEVVAALILLSPVLAPALFAAGVDPVLVGVLMVFTLGIGLVTPPVGVCLYVGSQVSGVKFEQVVAAVSFYIPAMLLTVIAMILFPKIATWLPYLVYPK